MDNDVFGTDYCIGFSTAVTRSVDAHHPAAHAHRLPRAHRRRRGLRPLQRRDLPHHRLPRRRRPRHHQRGALRRRTGSPSSWSRTSSANPSKYAIVCISEGAQHRGGEVIQRARPTPTATGSSAASARSRPSGSTDHRRGHHLPGARLHDALRRPDALDRMVAMNYGNMAADLSSKAPRDAWSRCAAAPTPTCRLGVTREGVKRVDVDELYDTDGTAPRSATSPASPCSCTDRARAALAGPGRGRRGVIIVGAGRTCLEEAPCPSSGFLPAAATAPA